MSEQLNKLGEYLLKGVQREVEEIAKIELEKTKAKIAEEIDKMIPDCEHCGKKMMKDEFKRVHNCQFFLIPISLGGGKLID